MKRDYLQSVLNTFDIYIDTCSLMSGNITFFKVTLFEILKKTKRKVFIVDAVYKELKKLQFTEAERYAVKGLDVIQFYRENGMVIDVETTSPDFADKAFLDILYQSRKGHKSVVLITEDKTLAKDIVINLKRITSVTHKNIIEAIRLYEGPRVWDVDEIKQKLRIDSDEGYKIIENDKSERLLISIVIDNSNSLNDERLSRLRSSLAEFSIAMNNSNYKSNIEYSVNSFDGFQPIELKGFTENSLSVTKFIDSGLPILGKTISSSLENLFARRKQLDRDSIITYKPWLIVLSDGDSFGDSNAANDSIKKYRLANDLIYFPFLLNSSKPEESFIPFAKVKPFAKIKGNQFNNLFNWILETSERRIDIPLSEKLRLTRESFEGWIAL